MAMRFDRKELLSEVLVEFLQAEESRLHAPSHKNDAEESILSFKS